MMKNYFLILVLSLLYAQVSIAKLPSSIPTCSRNDPEINKCIINAVNVVKPFLKNGDFGEGFKVLPIEPMSVDDIEMDRGNEFKAKLTDIVINGGSNFQIDNLKADASKVRFDVALSYPKVDFVGKYSLKLKLIVDISGNGDMKGHLENLKTKIRMIGRRFMKDGKELVKFDKMIIRIIVDKLNLRLENLFNGDKVLGDVGNQVINDNQKLFLAEITPGLEKGLSEYFLNVANKVLETTTYDEMFPDERNLNKNLQQN